MSRAAKYAFALIAGAVVIVGGYELDIMPLAGSGVLMMFLGIQWAKHS